MANTNKQFIEYDDALKIPKSKRDKMINSRTATRDRLKRWFGQNQPEYSISFWIQGSHKNNLNIRTRNEECDQDDGIYIDKDPSESVTGTTVQNWVVHALKGSTSKNPSHKKKCIRNNYQDTGVGPYHIDYPVYFKTNEMQHPLLAVKNDDLEESDPKEFTDWMNGMVDEKGQIKRLIRYLKGWADNLSMYQKMPNGLTLTVLVCNNYVASDDRDDKALYYTAQNIYNQLVGKWECVIPATPYDDLLHDKGDSFQNNLMNSLDNLISDGGKALEKECPYESSKLWRKHLGNRYPLTPRKAMIGSKASLASLVGSNKPYFNG